MNARQNPLAKLEAFMQRVIESPFNRLFPSKMEPIEIARKLERAMDDNTMLQGEGRRLSPNVYDIYLSIKDHQQMSPGQASLTRDWQNHLVEFAKRRHYTLKTVPIIRLHSDTSLRPGSVRIDTEQADREGGLMATQALSAEQLAQIRAQMAPGQQLPGIDGEVHPIRGWPGQARIREPGMAVMPSIAIQGLPRPSLLLHRHHLCRRHGSLFVYPRRDNKPIASKSRWSISAASSAMILSLKTNAFLVIMHKSNTNQMDNLPSLILAALMESQLIIRRICANIFCAMVINSP
nr:DUF3662 domain-containing protein [Dictyobacter kobayashii]